MAKRLVKTLKPYLFLYSNEKTGIAWVVDGTTGMSHSAHPNIDATGSVKGMKNLGYWNKNDKVVRCNGLIYNISKFVVSDENDKIASEHCRCEKCIERRRGEKNE